MCDALSKVSYWVTLEDPQAQSSLFFFSVYSHMLGAVPISDGCKFHLPAAVHERKPTLFWPGDPYIQLSAWKLLWMFRGQHSQQWNPERSSPNPLDGQPFCPQHLNWDWIISCVCLTLFVYFRCRALFCTYDLLHSLWNHWRRVGRKGWLSVLL